MVSDGYDSADVLVASSSNSGEEWILDSGCSFHMSPNRELFVTLTEEHG